MTILFDDAGAKTSEIILIGHGLSHDLQSLGLTSTEVTGGKRVCYIDTEVYSAVSQKR